MEHSTKPSSSKHDRAHKGEREHHSKKRHNSERDAEPSKKRKRKDHKVEPALHIVDQASDDNEVWEEKNIDMEGEEVRSVVFPQSCVVTEAIVV